MSGGGQQLAPARARRVERRIGRSLHWWEAYRLENISREFDGIAARCRAFGNGSKLATFKLSEEADAPLGLTWTTEAA